MVTHEISSNSHRWLACAKRGRKHLRLVKGGAEILCKSCNEVHFYSRQHINDLWDQIEEEEARKSHNR